MKKILLKNGRIVLKNKLVNGSISIFDGKIEKIFESNFDLDEKD